MKKKLSILAFVILISVGGMIFSKSFTKQEQLKLSTKGLDNTRISEVEESKDNPILDDDKNVAATEEEKGNEKLKENKEESKENKENKEQLKEDKDKYKTKENKETINEKDSIENKKSQSETKISEPTKESKGDTQSSESKNNEVKTETKNNTTVNPKEPERKQEPNVSIVNGITGNVIVSEYMNIEGKSAYDVTLEILEKNKINKRIKSGYFASMAGLEERKPEKTSGWCYYVNGVKPGIGSLSYTLKKGDKLVWKFLLDGINN
ncbi:surface/cell-adhesion protein [Clostridium putrefaciens]|uniref:Surface/cell-adhesion protein n=1 Tax=Clostridium putrefaciens TaxID=99675 RepID=A0A381J7V3_9CLOT|nr:DUF4430 domain-containing protein [Clostridium putrefaciens]SUY46768.1 surface/cell-adhesion protein [Clostridium putrefaciens]